MSFIDQALDPIKIPKFVNVRQNFPRPVVADAAAELSTNLQVRTETDPASKTCPDCGRPYSVHHRNCRECGEPLSK